MSKEPEATNNVAGNAALSICESLLIALSDLKIMSSKDIGDLLKDAADAHRTASATSPAPQLHLDIVSIIERIAAGGNSVPRP